MARTSTTAKPNNAAYDVSATLWNAHVGDYVSQSDTNAQTVAGPINFTNATVTKSAAALATETVAAGYVTTHAALTTGVHGVGAGTVAKTADITDANLTCTDVTTNNSSTTKHGFLKKLDDDDTHFMRGDGSWAVPAGASGAPGAYTYLVKLNGADTEAYNSTGTLTFGGATDEGAVDGADGSAVLQACMAAGNTIAIQGVITGRIEITASNVTLIGAGEAATLKLPASADDHVVDITGSGVINVRVMNLIIDGNKANNTAGCGILCDTDYSSVDCAHVFQNLTIVNTSSHGISILSDTRVCFLSNIYIGGSSTNQPEGRGFDLQGTDHHVVNCEVGFAEKSGFYIKAVASHLLNCKAFACGSDDDAHDNAQFSFVGTNAGCYNSVTNCVAQDGKYTGFELYNGARDNTFVNCHADDNGQTSDSVAIKLDTDCVRNAFVGCRLFDYAGTHMTDGFELGATCDFNQVSGCYIWNAQGDGVEVTGGDSNLIQDNYIYSSGAYGVSVEAGCTNNWVCNNYIVDSTTAAISDAGTTTTVRSNFGYVTENAGTGSITSGGTTDVITHGCSYTPARADIAITLGENPSNTPGAIWVDTITATEFTVNCENDPGASNLDFSWAVRKV